MKKSLSRILARMAKDGDIETVAEIIEEMIEPEAAETPVEAIAETVAEIAPAVAAAEPEAVIQTPEATIVVDEATLGDIISRLDQIISLLSPAVTDEDPVEEVAEAVEEALEAILPEEILPDEDPPEGSTPEEVSEIIEEILDPVSDLLDPAGDECDPDEEQEVLSTGDALRAALHTVGPALLRVPEKERGRLRDKLVATAIRHTPRKASDATAVDALATMSPKPLHGDPADLGRRIMASRNINCQKK